MSRSENKIVRTEAEQECANKMFDALRDELLKRELSNTENYDKAILTLSSASLGFSLIAIWSVVPLDTGIYLWVIKLSWALLLISITTSLVAYLLSNKAIFKQLSNARKYYKEGSADTFNRPNIFIKINRILNYTTGLLFISALSAIVIFVTLNIGRGTNTMSKEIKDTKNTTEMVKRSANIPEMEQAPGVLPTSQGGNDRDDSNSGVNTGSTNSNSEGNPTKTE